MTGGTSSLLSRHFIGDAFADQLFNTENVVRELACAWKVQSSLPIFGRLATGSMWKWRAVGIPLNLLGGSIEGDIDLMLALRPQGSSSDLHRCIELKTAKVNLSGEVKSLKNSKFPKTIKQLEKLVAFGAPQVLLLEAFIVEAGYGPASGGKMPVAVRNSIADKLRQIGSAAFGYATIPLEQLRGYAEDATGMLWPFEIIKAPPIRPTRRPFLDLVDAIEECVRKSAIKRFGLVVTYCHQCAQLITVRHRGPYICSNCRSPLI